MNSLLNTRIISFGATDEQVAYAKQLVEHSLTAHEVPNIWDDVNIKDMTTRARLSGVLAEIAFADLLHLPRPTRAYGASDGQDYGADFIVAGKRIDVKSMMRKYTQIKRDYVFNIASRQLEDPLLNTDYFVCIGTIQQPQGYKIQLYGKISKERMIRDSYQPEKGTVHSKGDSGKSFAHAHLVNSILITNLDAINPKNLDLPNDFWIETIQ